MIISVYVRRLGKFLLGCMYQELDLSMHMLKRYTLGHIGNAHSISLAWTWEMSLFMMLQEHRFVRILSWKYDFRFNINPNEELRWMFICGISVAPKVSLVLSELTTSAEMEMWVYWILRLWLNCTFKSKEHKNKGSKVVWVPADEKLGAKRLGS
jgi:hypothetical protein